MVRNELNELVKTIRKTRNNEAILELKEKVKPLIYSMIKKYGFNWESYEDLYQDAVVELFVSVEKYDFSRGVPFIAFYQKNLFYLLINKLNKNEEIIQLDQSINEDGYTYRDNLISEEKDSLENLIWREDRIRLSNALEKLSEKQKWIIEEYYFLGNKLVDLSNKYGIHYQSLVKLKARALKKLRIYLNRDLIN